MKEPLPTMSLNVIFDKVNHLWEAIVQATWFRHDVLIPFIISRAAMLLIIWAGQLFLPSFNAPENGPLPFGERLLYLFTMWDAGWYMSIITDGYTPSADLTTIESNIAFFPVYPFLVRSFALFLPHSLRTVPNLVVIGVVLSNLLFVGALAIIHRIVCAVTDNPEVARRTIFYLLIFPTSFYFSAFYSEATYLFFVSLTIWAMWQRRWPLAGVLAGVAALSRPLGILLVGILLWQYMYERRVNGRWTLRAIDYNIVWLGCAPAALTAYFLFQYQLTGDFFAPIAAQGAWGREYAWPWQNLTIGWPIGTEGFYILRLNQIFLFAFTGLSLLVWRRLPFALALFSLAHILPSLASGSFDSAIRYCTVIFPVFILLALWSDSRLWRQALVYIFLTLQTLLLAAWSQGYWVV